MEGEEVPLAVVDQLEAADAHAGAVFTLLAADVGAQLVAPALGEPASAPLMAWLAGLVLESPGRRAAGCRHLRVRPVAAGVWCAWSPWVVRCRDCVAVVGRRLRGQPAEDRCDACSRTETVRVPVWLWAVALRGVADRPAPAPAGPTVLLIRFCGRCHGDG